MFLNLCSPEYYFQQEKESRASRDEESPTSRTGRTIPIGQEERCKRAPLPETQPADSTEERASV